MSKMDDDDFRLVARELVRRTTMLLPEKALADEHVYKRWAVAFLAQQSVARRVLSGGEPAENEQKGFAELTKNLGALSAQDINIIDRTFLDIIDKNIDYRCGLVEEGVLVDTYKALLVLVHRLPSYSKDAGTEIILALADKITDAVDAAYRKGFDHRFVEQHPYLPKPKQP